MPKAWSAKDERQYEHVKASEKKKGGRSAKRAKEIAARTVNKQRSAEGRTKKQSNGSSGSKKSSTSRSSNGRGRSTTKSQSGGRSLEDKTKDELYSRAKKLHIDGRSKMNKQQLVRAIRKAA